MPSSTFLKLPQEKREKFLAAARAEFARVPYPDASINQIIRGAGIPRGSFYMYFRDKGDLFSYLLCEYSQRIEGLMRTFLDRREGDLFEAFLDMYDFIQTGYRDPVFSKEYQIILEIAQLNSTLIAGFFLTDSHAAQVADGINADRLNLRGDTDLEDMLRILIAVTGPALRDGVPSLNPAAARQRYINTLDILARGMTKQ